jgi:hypothetical protein
MTDPLSGVGVSSDGALISAANGIVDFSATTGNVSVTALALASGDGPIIGTVTARGNNVDFTVSGLVHNANLTIGTILANGEASTLSAEGGSLGTAASPLQTSAVQFLNANTGTTGSGSVYVHNVDANGTGLTIADQNGGNATGGTYHVESTGNIAAASGIQTTKGNLELAVIPATGQLSFAASAYVAGGDMFISVGGNAHQTCNASTPACIPLNAHLGVVQDLTKVFFNNPAGIQVDGPLGSFFNESSGRVLALDSNGTSIAIHLSNSSAFTVH